MIWEQRKSGIWDDQRISGEDEGAGGAAVLSWESTGKGEGVLVSGMIITESVHIMHEGDYDTAVQILKTTSTSTSPGEP